MANPAIKGGDMECYVFGVQHDTKFCNSVALRYLGYRRKADIRIG